MPETVKPPYDPAIRRVRKKGRAVMTVIDFRKQRNARVARLMREFGVDLPEGWEELESLFETPECGEEEATERHKGRGRSV